MKLLLDHFRIRRLPLLRLKLLNLGLEHLPLLPLIRNLSCLGRRLLPRSLELLLQRCRSSRLRLRHRLSLRLRMLQIAIRGIQIRMLVLERREVVTQRPHLSLQLRSSLVALLPTLLLPLLELPLFPHQQRPVSFQSFRSSGVLLDLGLQLALGRGRFEHLAFVRVLELLDVVQSSRELALGCGSFGFCRIGRGSQLCLRYELGGGSPC